MAIVDDTTAGAEHEDVSHTRWSRIAEKLGPSVNLLESRFLGVLRLTAIVFAAGFLIAAAVYLAYGSVQQIGQTEVDREPVSMAADDILPPKVAPSAAPTSTPTLKAEISREVRNRTLAVYRARFKPFQRSDTKITDEQVVDLTWPEERLKVFDQLGGEGLVGKDGIELSNGQAVMLDALGAAEATASTGEFHKQLAAYHDAKKINSCTDQARVRSRTVDGWDQYATHCEGWYLSPVGCPAPRVVQESFVEKVCEMKFPDDLQAPAQQLANAMQRYADGAHAKLQAARIDAEERTARNQARKLEGMDHIGTGGKLFLAFLAVMFLYLFVALERHQRTLRLLVGRG